MSKEPVFKVHWDKEKGTVDILFRVSVIGNGYLIKAGGPAYHCPDEAHLRKTIDEMLERFFRELPKSKKDDL